MAFGFGVHQCLGQPLARLELQVVYGTLFRRVRGVRAAGHPVTGPRGQLAFRQGLLGRSVIGGHGPMMASTAADRTQHVTVVEGTGS